MPELVDGLNRGDKHQVLLGVTGSGKTYTMAQAIARVNRPTLVMAHNKTLAAQLYQEFRRFFPRTPSSISSATTTTTSPKPTSRRATPTSRRKSTINDEIDRMRLSATRSLFERRDVIIVASVSCIYGLGSPEAYYGMLLPLERGHADGSRPDPAQARRNSVRAQRPRVRPRHVPRARRHHRGLSRRTKRSALRIGLFGDEVDELVSFDPMTGKTSRKHDRIAVYPKSHFVTSRARLKEAVETIKAELVERRAPTRARRQAARGAAAASAHDVRSRDDSRDRLLPRDRELLPAPYGPPPGRAAADAARLPASGRAGDRRRESSDGAAGSRDVFRRSVAQGGARRLRVPPAIRARQPAAEFRRVGSARAAARLRLGDTRSLRTAQGAAASSSSR